jgi:hypothetical protein
VTEPTTPESSQRAVDESEAAAGADEASAADADAEVAQPAAGKGRRTVGVVLTSVLGVVALLCVGGLGTGYFLYHKASEPDRSTPGLAVRQYVEAALNERDDSRSRLFTCSGATSLDQVAQLRDDIKAKESQFGVTIRTSPEGFDAQQAGNTARVGVKIRLSVSTNGTFQEQIQDWRFSLRKESGWRVCSGERLG